MFPSTFCQCSLVPLNLWETFNKARYWVSFPVPSVFFWWRFNVNVLQDRLIESQLLSNKGSGNSSSSSCSAVTGKPVVLKHFVSVDSAVSDHALAIQLVTSDKAISLQRSETLLALSILRTTGQSNNLTPIILLSFIHPNNSGTIVDFRFFALQCRSMSNWSMRVSHFCFQSLLRRCDFTAA